MKKLFGSKSARDDRNSLINKTVQVGQYHVRVDALLGSGGYAEIYRVMDISNGQKYALKHLRLNGDQEIIKEVQQEAKTQAKLRGHPNILRLHAVSFAGPKGGETDGFFLLDFCPGTLLDLLAKHNFQLEERTIIHIFNCVCQAIAHMHRQKPPMAHRDLKAENVLMLPDGSWILCDYGSATVRAGVYDTVEARAAEEEVIRKHTTPAYRPPEMWDLYQRQPIDTKVDIWALGVLLYVLCYGRLPFTGDSKLQILNGKYEMPPTRPTQLRGLIRVMLTLDPTQRPDVHSVLQQLDQAAKAITGRGVTVPPAAAAAQQQQRPATPPRDQQQVQQNVQQFLQQQQQQQPPPAGASTSLKTTSEATSSSTSSIVDQGVKQQQQVPQDWARFSNTPSPTPPAAPPTAAAAAAAPSAPVDVTQKRAPPPPPRPTAAAAATGLRAHALSTPEGSPLRAANINSSSSSSPAAADGLTTAAGPTTLANGYPSIAHYPHVPQQQQQQQASDLSKLADITARAAAVAAGRGQSAQLPQQQQQQQHGHKQAPTAVEPPVVLERQSRPYSSGAALTAATAVRPSAGAAAAAAKGSGSSPASTGGSGSAPSTPTTAPAAVPAVGSSKLRPQSASAGAAPAAVGVDLQQQQHSTTSAPAASAAVDVPATVPQQTRFAQSQSQQITAPVKSAIGTSAFTTTVAPDAGSAGSVSAPTDAAALTALRSAVFGEMDLLRAQVQSLSDENQAFVFRIKQLEQYSQQQAEAMAHMQQQLAALQKQPRPKQEMTRQQAVSAEVIEPRQQQQQHPDGLSGWLRRHSGGGVDGSSPQAAGINPQRQQQQQQQGPANAEAPSGTFWSTQSALL